MDDVGWVEAGCGRGRRAGQRTVNTDLEEGTMLWHWHGLVICAQIIIEERRACYSYCSM